MGFISVYIEGIVLLHKSIGKFLKGLAAKVAYHCELVFRITSPKKGFCIS